MNRFSNQNNMISKMKKVKLPIIAFGILFVFFLFGIQSISLTTSEKRAESLKTAIYRSVVQCYAVEGSYPPSLTYLEEHYGLIYDTELFFVDYNPIGSNIMPDITIISKNTVPDKELKNGF